MTTSTTRAAEPRSPEFDLAAVHLSLDRKRPDYQAGDLLRATVTLPTTAIEAVRNAELSIVWYTAGKGDEDLHVHEFRRWAVAVGQAEQNATPTETIETVSPLIQSLTTTLPMSPLSYSGVIVKVCWCVRLRMFLSTGKQLMMEEPFRLGEVADSRTNESVTAEANK